MPTWSPAHTTAHQSGRRRAPHTRRPKHPPPQTCTATPTDATKARPLGTVRPHAHNPTENPSPKAPATPSTLAPEGHSPAPAQAKPAFQQHHDPPAGPAVQPTETPSSRRPAQNLGPDPDPDPTRATVRADTPRASEPGRELPAGIPHPEGGTQPARPASVEGADGTRALAGHVGGQPGPSPVPEGQTREAAQPAGGTATLPAPPAKPQREEPTVDATKETGGSPAADRSAKRQRRTCQPGDHPKRRYLTVGRTSQRTSVCARRTLRQAEATRHQTLANLVRDLANLCRTPRTPTNRPRGAIRGLRGRRPLRSLSASQRTRRAGKCQVRKGATTGLTWSPCDVRSPGSHNRHAQVCSRQRNVVRRAQSRRRLFRCLHGVLQ